MSLVLLLSSSGLGLVELFIPIICLLEGFSGCVSFCYCAHVLRMLRWSEIRKTVPAKLCGL